MEKKIGIIADDLTGANDSGVQLTEKGLNTSVLFEITEQTSHLDSGIVINTDSRALVQKQAFDVTKQAAEFLKKSGYPHIYKKMDSTLRGHIGTELKAINEVMNPEFIFISPAFPALGRTTKDGIHYVNGTKIADTETANDPKHPVKESFIPALIEKEIGEAVGLLKKEDVTSASVFQERINQLKQENIHYLVSDAETEEELLQAAREMSRMSTNVIWAGSAGLAEVLPEVLGLSEKTDTRSFPRSKQTITVCGSLSGVTQSQVRFAMKQPGVSGIELDTMHIFSSDWEKLKEDYLSTCIAKLREGMDIVLYLPSNDEIRTEVKKIGNQLGLSSNQIGERISGAIGEIVSKLVQADDKLSGLVLTGGDTAKDTAKALGGVGIRLVKQIEAGIPLGTLIGTDRDFTVVTKAGAFGKEGSIYHAIQELKGDHNHE